MAPARSSSRIARLLTAFLCLLALGDPQTWLPPEAQARIRSENAHCYASFDGNGDLRPLGLLYADDNEQRRLRDRADRTFPHGGLGWHMPPPATEHAGSCREQPEPHPLTPSWRGPVFFPLPPPTVPSV